MQVVSVKVNDIRPKYNNLYEWMNDPQNVYIGRRGVVFIDGILNSESKIRYPLVDSIWANPFKITDRCTREQCISLYRNYILEKIRNGDITRDDILNLKGKTLGCWCKTKTAPHTPCHGDVLINIINSNYDDIEKGK